MFLQFLSKTRWVKASTTTCCMSVTLQFTAICMQALSWFGRRARTSSMHGRKMSGWWSCLLGTRFGVRRTESCFCMLMFHLVWLFLYSYVSCSNPWHKFVMPKELTCINLCVSASKVFQMAVVLKQLSSFLQHFKIHPSRTLPLDKRS